MYILHPLCTITWLLTIIMNETAFFYLLFKYTIHNMKGRMIKAGFLQTKLLTDIITVMTCIKHLKTDMWILWNKFVNPFNKFNKFTLKQTCCLSALKLIYSMKGKNMQYKILRNEGQYTLIDQIYTKCKSKLFNNLQFCRNPTLQYCIKQNWSKASY